MLDRRVTYNGTESEWQEYIVHWMNIYRTWEENSLGVREFKWERQGADHYVHAAVYARIGLQKFAEAMATVVAPDVFLGTPTGRIFTDAPKKEATVIGYSPQDFRDNSFGSNSVGL